MAGLGRIRSFVAGEPHERSWHIVGRLGFILRRSRLAAWHALS